ncbi:MAG: ATP-grasp domain-containing protein, partial [Petrimonas sp.]|nr:ATP-grasp domain-containing protein [Petrimonas sp.]
MKIHEYQARELLASYGLPVDKAYICRNVEDAVRAYQELDAPLVVVKAQVHTGGRGKAGGVKLAKDEIELRQHVANILWMDIKGFIVDRVLIGKAVNIASEYYVSYVIDRKSKSTILMLSREGGMDIEEVARNTPEKIHKIVIDPLIGVPDYLAREAAFKLFDDIKPVREAATIFQKLYKLFVDTDASLAEINPLV